jgi:hypothetical protein
MKLVLDFLIRTIDIHVIFEKLVIINKISIKRHIKLNLFKRVFIHLF